MYDLLVRRCGKREVHSKIYRLALDYQTILPKYSSVDSMRQYLKSLSNKQLEEMHKTAHIAIGNRRKKNDMINTLITREYFANHFHRNLAYKAVATPSSQLESNYHNLEI